MIGFNSETKFNVKNTRWRLAGDQRFKGFKPWTIQAQPLIKSSKVCKFDKLKIFA